MATVSNTDDPVPLTLILGGARSGKSAFAEQLALRQPNPIYIATAQAFDSEMQTRIAHHRARRNAAWTTVEEPRALAEAIRIHAHANRIVLVDCLTLWLSNLMLAERTIETETEMLVKALASAAGPIILVSNEVGLGIVPETPLARAFRDHAGRLHQQIAAIAQQVYFMVAGLPMTVKMRQNKTKDRNIKQLLDGPIGYARTLKINEQTCQHT